MKRLCAATLITLFASLSGVARADGLRLELGEILPKKFLQEQRSPAPKVQTFADTFDPFVELELNGIRYTIAYQAKTRVITYIYTIDLRFRTVQGLKVGDEISLSREQISFYEGWQVYAPTACDGWKTVIGYDREPKTFFFEENIPPYREPENPLTLFNSSKIVKFRIWGFFEVAAAVASP